MPKRRGNALRLFLSALAACAVCGALVYVVYTLWPRWPANVSTEAPSLPITVAGTLFNVPPASIRVAMQRRPGPQERLDLYFSWPDLTAPKAMTPQEDNARLAMTDRVFVTIRPADNTLSPIDRLRNVFPRHLEDATFSDPSGLIGRKFKDGGPYQGEDLLSDLATSERFFVRCTRAGAIHARCVLDRRIENTDVSIRFPREWLGEWREALANMERLLVFIRPPG